MTPALPFRLVGEADRQALRQALGEAAGDWASTWFATSPEADFDFPGESETAGGNSGQWLVLSTDPDRWVAWQLAGSPWRELAQLLLDAPVGPSASPTSLVESLLDECRLDLASRLFGAAGPGADSAHTARTSSLAMVRTGYGSGAVFGCLCGGFPAQPIALGGSIVAGLLGKRPSAPTGKAPLVARESAITSGVMGLELILGHAELTLAELAHVAAGDVIRLQSSFRDPLTVRTADGTPLLRAHLGTHNDRKAIQVIGKTS